MTTRKRPGRRRYAPLATSRSGLVVITFVMLATLVLAWMVDSGPRHRTSAFAASVGRLDADSVPNGWAPLIQDAADVAGVPAPVLAAQLETESNWRADARSPVGAQGLAQFMPATWETYGHGGDPFNPAHAIAAQGRFMGHLMDRAEASDIHGDPLELALAGYNAGFGSVQRYDGIPPYPQTENYVRLIRERTANYER